MRSNSDYVEMDSKNQRICRGSETCPANSYQDDHFKAGDDNQLNPLCINLHLYNLLQIIKHNVLNQSEYCMLT